MYHGVPPVDRPYDDHPFPPPTPDVPRAAPRMTVFLLSRTKLTHATVGSRKEEEEEEKIQEVNIYISLDLVNRCKSQ